MHLSYGLAVLVSVTIADAPWSTFRGGAGLTAQGVASGPIVKPTLLWQTEPFSDQRGDGSLVIGEGAIFFATTSNAEDLSTVYAVDVGSGALQSTWWAPPSPDVTFSSRLAVVIEKKVLDDFSARWGAVSADRIRELALHSPERPRGDIRRRRHLDALRNHAGRQPLYL